MFSKEIVDEIETIINLNEENQTRTPIAYRGTLFYLYAINEEGFLQFVPINAIYVNRSFAQNYHAFIPTQIVEIDSDDSDFEYIREIIRYPQVQVTVKFAEIEGNRMQIVLKNVEVLTIDIEENSTFRRTGRFYRYHNDNDSYTLE